MEAVFISRHRRAQSNRASPTSPRVPVYTRKPKSQATITFQKKAPLIEEQAKEIKRSSRCEQSIESLGEVLETREGTPATCGVFAASSDVV